MIESGNRWLLSANHNEGKFIENENVIDWINDRASSVDIQIEQMKLSEMRQWSLDRNSGSIVHETGAFFSIEGLDVNTSIGSKKYWQQPIINQQEIGILGCIVKEFSGVLHFLIQAKIEPGNINHVQLSPTLQATRSNYMQVHKGNAPKYLEYFTNRNLGSILIDQLQSEQGARFLGKRNRNIIVEVFSDIDIEDGFIWLTLGQIKELARIDNLINMDLRTVISNIRFDLDKDLADSSIRKILQDDNSDLKFLDSAQVGTKSLYSDQELISWITDLKSRNEVKKRTIPIDSLSNWNFTEDGIEHNEEKYFKVKWVNVMISNREVIQWDQPILEPKDRGIVAFIVKEIDGVLHFLVQAKFESGTFDMLELAPTISCCANSYDNPSQEVPYLDYYHDASMNSFLFNTLQSEEGGRFYQEQNHTSLIYADDSISSEANEFFKWMTLGQLMSFLRYNNYVNIQARSIISMISVL